MMFVPCIRWSGGKRKQSEDIINKMPYEIDTFWIPFLGGGSVMFQLLNSNIKFNKVVASDIYAPLMGIWDYIQNNPEELLSSYREHYNKFFETEDYYYDVVDMFNAQSDDEKDPLLFHFLTRSCMRGSIEFDKRGKFITKHQSSRTSGESGVSSPDTLRPIIMRWHDAIKDVDFRCESYDKIVNEVQSGDYCFFDPPYIDGTWYKDNNLDMDAFYDFLRALPCDYSITLNGDRDIYPIPDDLYTKHEYIYYGVSKASNGRPTGSRDSFWMRHNSDKYDPTKVNAINNPRQVGGLIPQNTDYKLIAEVQNDVNILKQDVTTMKGSLDQILQLLIGGTK